MWRSPRRPAAPVVMRCWRRCSTTRGCRWHSSPPNVAGATARANLKDRKLATKVGDDWQLTRAGKVEAKALKEERATLRQHAFLLALLKWAARVNRKPISCQAYEEHQR